MKLRTQVLELMLKNKIKPEEGIRVLFGIISDTFLSSHIEPDELKKSLDSLYGIYVIEYDEKYNNEEEDDEESISFKEAFINDLKELKGVTMEDFLKSEKSMDIFIKIAKKHGMSSKNWDTNDQ